MEELIVPISLNYQEEGAKCRRHKVVVRHPGVNPEEKMELMISIGKSFFVYSDEEEDDEDDYTQKYIRID